MKIYKVKHKGKLRAKLYHTKDSLFALRKLPDNSVDSIVTDPPYGINFMGKNWDYDVPSVDLWRECLRVLKPGGHLLAFAGTRTQHVMCMRIENAGFEIRDMLAWVYGSGFPKSQNVKKSVNKIADIKIANQWDGWGTALKPALEPITLARKPLSESTITKNVLKHGTGGLNIDRCRVPTTDVISNHGRSAQAAKTKGIYSSSKPSKTHQTEGQKLGRWPANFIHDGSKEALLGFPESKDGVAVGGKGRSPSIYGSKTGGAKAANQGYGGSGSVGRFFYSAKASKRDKHEGLEKLNNHPTVKPTELMKYLCRLVTKPNGIVLDPFMGSGSTGKACMLEGFRFIGMERETDYVTIAISRIKHAVRNSV